MSFKDTGIPIQNKKVTIEIETYENGKFLVSNYYSIENFQHIVYDIPQSVITDDGTLINCREIKTAKIIGERKIRIEIVVSDTVGELIAIDVNYVHKYGRANRIIGTLYCKPEDVEETVDDLKYKYAEDDCIVIDNRLKENENEL